MTGNGNGSEGPISEVPWALVFDPAINVRALGEIQARGFRAAADLVDRFVNITDDKPARAEPDEVASDHEQQRAPTRGPDIERLLESWKAIIGQLAGSFRGTASQPDGAAMDLAGSHASGVLRLHATGPGVARAEVWLHNGGPTDRGTVVMRCGDLVSHDGSVIKSSHVMFDPPVVPMPARCSRGVSVQVNVDDGIAFGHYHGTLLVDGDPDIWLPVMLTVQHADV
ncbi:MAG: hypothetical protein ACM4D3_20495 [Candidatus Sericytochromatia bacterium]